MKRDRNVIKVDFKPPENAVHHPCTAIRDGDWLVFRCSECSSYERRLNWRTGAMKVKNDSPDIFHTGEYFPREYKEIFENVN